MPEALFYYMGTSAGPIPNPGNTYADQIKREIREAEEQGIYTYLNPKQEAVVPHEYVVQTLSRGSGFVGGKKRIWELYQEDMPNSERAARIKKEYGQGSAGWSLDGYGLHGYNSFHGKGLQLQWRDAEGEKVGYLSWPKIERELAGLIWSGEYYQPLPEEYEDLDREDVIDGTEWEMPEETADEVIDGYAIPDEKDEMGTPDYIRAGRQETVQEPEIDLSEDMEEPEPENETAEDFGEPAVTAAGQERQSVSDGSGKEYGQVSGGPEISAEGPGHGELSEEKEPAAQDDRLDLSTLPKPPRYHADLLPLESAGAKTRFGWNMEAIRTLKQIESEKRYATPEEQKVLARYDLL